jgi:hypothetical protein
MNQHLVGIIYGMSSIKTNPKQELPVAVMFVNEMSNLYRGTSKGAYYRMLVHLGKRFQRRSLSRNEQPETRIA